MIVRGMGGVSMAKAFPDIKVGVKLDIDIYTAQMMCAALNSFINNNSDQYKLTAGGISNNYDRIERRDVEQVEWLEVRKLEGWEKR